MDNWYVPITLLPSVGFFIMATTTASNGLSAEIARLIEFGNRSNRHTIRRKIRQLELVNVALVLLYGAAALLSVAGLMAGLEFSFMWHAAFFVNVVICLAIFLVLVSFGILILYATRAVRIKKEQFDDMTSPGPGSGLQEPE